MQRLIMDMRMMIPAAIRHAADHREKAKVVALVIEDHIQRWPFSCVVANWRNKRAPRVSTAS